MTCPTGITPFTPGRVNRTAINPTGTGADNCQNGGLLSFSSTVTVLAAANGTLRTVALTEGGAPGDFIRLQPFEGKMRIHDIFFAGVAASIDAVGFRGVFKNGKEVQPTMTGSLAGAINCGAAANYPLNDGVGADVNVLNPDCLPSFDNDSPIEIALSNNTGGDIVICYTVVLEYVVD
jgi:hypothetical protein